MLDTGASRAWRGSFRVRSANVSRGACEVAEQAAAPAAKGPRPRAASSRVTFDRDLDALVREVCALGVLASAALESALEVLAAEAPSLCDAVIEGDDVVDERYLAIQREVLRLIALQAPVASDARLLIASMHIGLHLERIGDLAVNVAELTKLSAGLPRDPVVVRNLEVMGATALGMAEQVWFMVTGELREFTSPAQVRGE